VKKEKSQQKKFYGQILDTIYYVKIQESNSKISKFYTENSDCDCMLSMKCMQYNNSHCMALVSISAVVILLTTVTGECGRELHHEDEVTDKDTTNLH
jgi:hypothetical protein